MANVLKVRAKPGVLVALPRQVGAVAQYVGRKVDHAAFAAGEDDHEKLYPIDGEPEFSSKTDYAVFSEIARAVRHGDLIAADEFTAQHCAVKFEAPAATGLYLQRSAKGEE